MASVAERIFTVPPGAAFASTVAHALLEGRLIPGLAGDDVGFAFAATTIFTPTQRAARALTREFVRKSLHGVALVPRIIPLGRLESLELGYVGDEIETATDTGAWWPTISEMERRLTLTALIEKWARQLQAAAFLVDSPATGPISIDEPNVVGVSPASAWAMAGELAALIDEFAIEAIEWESLERLVPDEFGAYWKISHDFLKIAGNTWPRHLAERRLMDRSQYQVSRIDAEIDRLEKGYDAGPLIVAGSTGANRATARLIAAIARYPMGAVILPGLDTNLDSDAWHWLTTSDAVNRDAASTHPQAAMARLLNSLGADRQAIVSLAAAPKKATIRNWMVSEALRPAETTDVWKDTRSICESSHLPSSMNGIAIAECVDPREEALCIAIKLREAHEQKIRAALVTPDRDIARRVKAQLARWNIEIDDSAGEPLSKTIWGAYARLVFASTGREARCVNFVALLEHPLSRFGLDQPEFERLSRLLNIAVLRIPGNPLGDPAQLIAKARRFAHSSHAHPNIRSISDASWQGMMDLLTRVANATTELRLFARKASITRWAQMHLRAMADMEPANEHIDGDGRRELDQVLTELAEHGHLSADIDRSEYERLFERVLAGQAVRNERTSDRRIHILGLLEARLLDFQLVVLAGLEEGLWPPRAHTDPFLNRSMRADLGMSSPERRIGQTAHDLAQLLGAPNILILRTLKRAGAPTVPSRFLQRIAAFVGASAWVAAVARGAVWVDLARLIDARDRKWITPPRPQPPVAIRPASLSVTRIETLRRDPYSIYAESILELKQLDPLGASLGPREYGVYIHAVVDSFARLSLTKQSGDISREALFKMAREIFAPFFQKPGFLEFTWPSLEKALDAYRKWELERASQVRTLHLELSGRMPIALSDGSIFTLSARADRIELLDNGCARILDFKSGRLPTKAEVDAGFAPQLVLEAKMLASRAFGLDVQGEVSGAYVKLGGADILTERPLGSSNKPFPALVEEQFDGLVRLLNQLRLPQTAFVSRPYPRFLARFGAYDHLARVKEWSTLDDEGNSA